jgi:hypothetical protein
LGLFGLSGQARIARTQVDESKWAGSRWRISELVDGERRVPPPPPPNNNNRDVFSVLGREKRSWRRPLAILPLLPLPPSVAGSTTSHPTRGDSYF